MLEKQQVIESMSGGYTTKGILATFEKHQELHKHFLIQAKIGSESTQINCHTTSTLAYHQKLHAFLYLTILQVISRTQYSRWAKRNIPYNIPLSPSASTVEKLWLNAVAVVRIIVIVAARSSLSPSPHRRHFPDCRRRHVGRGCRLRRRRGWGW
uniref:Uncharacterized protein n=1 Tax=Physcomitrium patens TaxID=3218 RepID=A0A2K1K6H9_PHYPA|nr:hypothetical protein PHYPA_011275 [Physcomitrium patens]